MRHSTFDWEHRKFIIINLNILMSMRKITSDRITSYSDGLRWYGDKRKWDKSDSNLHFRCLQLIFIVQRLQRLTMHVSMKLRRPIAYAAASSQSCKATRSRYFSVQLSVILSKNYRSLFFPMIEPICRPFVHRSDIVQTRAMTSSHESS